MCLRAAARASSASVVEHDRLLGHSIGPSPSASRANGGVLDRHEVGVGAEGLRGGQLEHLRARGRPAPGGAPRSGRGAT